MSSLPKLKIQSFLEPESKVKICDLGQAESYINYGVEMVVLMEGNLIHSHQELAELVRKEPYRDKEFLEVTILPVIEGG